MGWRQAVETCWGSFRANLIVGKQPYIETHIAHVACAPHIDYGNTVFAQGMTELNEEPPRRCVCLKMIVTNGFESCATKFHRYFNHLDAHVNAVTGVCWGVCAGGLGDEGQTLN